MKYGVIIIILCCWVALFAQNTAGSSTPQATVIPAITDSVDAKHEQTLLSQYGIDTALTLAQLATAISVPIDTLKTELQLDLRNKKIDQQTIQQLRIDPYRIVLVKQKMQYGIHELNTLGEVSKILHIPTKKIKSYLGLDTQDKSINEITLLALNVPVEKIAQVEKDFHAGMAQFGKNITLVGMLVVFTALLVTALLIEQLKHLGRKKETKANTVTLQTSVGKIKAEEKAMSQNAIIAVITALHAHSCHTEERKKIHLTWERNRLSMWRAAGRVELPNQVFGRNRRS